MTSNSANGRKVNKRVDVTQSAETMVAYLEHAAIRTKEATARQHHIAYVLREYLPTLAEKLRASTKKIEPEAPPKADSTVVNSLRSTEIKPSSTRITWEQCVGMLVMARSIDRGHVQAGCIEIINRKRKKVRSSVKKIERACKLLCSDSTVVSFDSQQFVGIRFQDQRFEWLEGDRIHFPPAVKNRTIGAVADHGSSFRCCTVVS